MKLACMHGWGRRGTTKTEMSPAGGEAAAVPVQTGMRAWAHGWKGAWVKGRMGAFKGRGASYCLGAKSSTVPLVWSGSCHVPHCSACPTLLSLLYCAEVEEGLPLKTTLQVACNHHCWSRHVSMGAAVGAALLHGSCMGTHGGCMGTHKAASCMGLHRPQGRSISLQLLSAPAKCKFHPNSSTSGVATCDMSPACVMQRLAPLPLLHPYPY